MAGDKFHGGVYEFLQNSYFNASNPLTMSTPRVRANDFGAYIGGPLFVPGHHMRGKTFFFGRLRRHPPPGVGIDFNQHTGRSHSALAIYPPSAPPDSRRLASATTWRKQIHHPFSAVPYLNNQVPVNASSLSLVNALYPLPNVTTPGAPANFVENFPGNYTLNNGDARIDENFTDKHHLWARFGAKNVAKTGTDGSTSYDPINGLYSSTNRLRNFVADYSWTITPTILNELRGGESISDLRTGYPFGQRRARPSIWRPGSLAFPLLHQVAAYRQSTSPMAASQPVTEMAAPRSPRT